MMLMIINFINAQKFIIIYTISDVSWLPPLISQLFSPRLFEGHPLLYSLAIFEWILTINTPMSSQPLKGTVLKLTLTLQRSIHYFSTEKDFFLFLFIYLLMLCAEGL